MRRLLSLAPFVAVFFAILGLMFATPATAEDFFWNVETGSGYVSDFWNWVGAGVPGDDVNLDDYVYLNNPGTMLIDETHLFGGQIRHLEVGGDASGGNVEQTGGNVDFRFQFHNGYGALADSTSSYSLINADMTQDGGSYTTIGGNGSHGSMTISGGTEEDRAYYRCTSGNQFRVGYGTEGTGTFEMIDYARCQLGKFIRLGYGTDVTGTMTMSGNSYATIYKRGDNSYIGRGAGATGRLEMSGDAQFEMLVYPEEEGGTIYLGAVGAENQLASGTIDLRGNAHLKTIGQINAGNNDYCRATINVTGSALFESANTIFFGVTGGETTVTEMNVSTGAEPGATGGRFQTGGQLVTGRGCITTVNLSETGSIAVGTTLRLGDGGGTSTVNLDGGTLECKAIFTGDGDFTVGATTGILNLNGGTIKATDSTTDLIYADADYADQTVNVKAGGAIFDTDGYDVAVLQPLLEDAASTGGGLTKIGEGTLTLSGANTYTGDTLVEAGTLSITGATMLSDTADLWLATGAVMDLDFTALSGTETVSSLYLDNVSQAAGTWGATGSGATHINDTYFTGEGTITVASTVQIPGDTNGDMKVNSVDAEKLADHWGQTIGGGPSVGDFNGDGTVNMLDASILAANWGDHTPGEAANVPEPGTLALLIGLGMMLLVRHARR